MSFQSTPVRTRSQTRSRPAPSSPYTRLAGVSSTADIANFPALRDSVIWRRNRPQRTYASIFPSTFYYASTRDSSISNSSVLRHCCPALPSPTLSLTDRSPHTTSLSPSFSERQASAAASPTSFKPEVSLESVQKRPTSHIQREIESTLGSLSPRPLPPNTERVASGSESDANTCVSNRFSSADTLVNSDSDVDGLDGDLSTDDHSDCSESSGSSTITDSGSEVEDSGPQDDFDLFGVFFSQQYVSLVDFRRRYKRCNHCLFWLKRYHLAREGNHADTCILNQVLPHDSYNDAISVIAALTWREDGVPIHAFFQHIRRCTRCDRFVPVEKYESHCCPDDL